MESGGVSGGGILSIFWCGFLWLDGYFGYKNFDLKFDLGRDRGFYRVGIFFLVWFSFVDVLGIL